MYGDESYVIFPKASFVDEREGGHVARGSKISHCYLAALEVGDRFDLAPQLRRSEQTEDLFRVVLEDDTLRQTPRPPDDVSERANVPKIQLANCERLSHPRAGSHHWVFKLQRLLSQISLAHGDIQRGFEFNGRRAAPSDHRRFWLLSQRQRCEDQDKASGDHQS